MKKRTMLLFLTILLLNMSCQDKPDQPKAEEPTKTQIEPSLSITFDFKTNKSDVFKIMMNNIEVDELQKKNIHIFEDITPASKEDRIIAKFDANNISRNIIINLGTKEIKEVEIINISISYGDKLFNFDTAKDINKYFAFNKFIDIAEDSKKVKTKRVEGKHNPAIFVRQNLINLLKKE